MATGTGGIATVANCSSKGCTATGYSNTAYCPKYSDFYCDSFTGKTISITSKVTNDGSVTTAGITTITQIVTTLSAALPFAIYVRYRARNASGTWQYKDVQVPAYTTSVTTSSPFTVDVDIDDLTSYAPYVGTSSSPVDTSMIVRYKFNLSKSISFS